MLINEHCDCVIVNNERQSLAQT